jgi:hypothetical protein
MDFSAMRQSAKRADFGRAVSVVKAAIPNICSSNPFECTRGPMAIGLHPLAEAEGAPVE